MKTCAIKSQFISPLITIIDINIQYIISIPIYFTACQHGTYGQDCMQKCRCAFNVSCNPIDGACDNGQCIKGKQGKYCDRGK